MGGTKGLGPVNVIYDEGGTVENICKAMEGIVRRTHAAIPVCDMAFVYSVSTKTVAAYNLTTGGGPMAVQAHEEVAEHYGIPSLHLGLNVVRRHKTGRVVWEGPEEFTVPPSLVPMDNLDGEFIFAADGVHPFTHSGCQEYTRAIERALPSLLMGTNVTSNKVLRMPLEAANLEHTSWIPVDTLQRSGAVDSASCNASVSTNGLTLTPNTCRLNEDVRGHVLRDPGDSITVNFEGSYIGMYNIVGPTSGYLNVKIDHEHFKRVKLFDTFSFFVREAFHSLYEGLEPKQHSLTLEMSDEHPAKATIMATKNRTIAARHLNKTEALILAFCVA